MRDPRCGTSTHRRFADRNPQLHRIGRACVPPPVLKSILSFCMAAHDNHLHTSGSLLDEYVAKDYPEPKNLFDDYKGRGTPAQTQDMTLRVTMDLALDNKMVPFRQDRMNEAQKKKWNEVYDKIRTDVLKKRPQGDDLVRWKYQRYMADYLACIKSLDESVGTMLDYLDESGLAENTVVIYASDQGFFLGEHGWFDKRFMYEESLRTPLLVRWPGVSKPGTVNKKMVSNLDLQVQE